MGRSTTGGAAISEIPYLMNKAGMQPWCARSSTGCGNTPSTTVASMPRCATTADGPRAGHRDRRPVGGRLAEEHQHDHADVEERRDRRGSRTTDDDQRQSRRRRSAAWNTAYLPKKPLVSGMPAKASRKKAKTPGQQRRALAQPGPARQVPRLAARVADQRDHRERADRGEAVAPGRTGCPTGPARAVLAVAMTPVSRKPAVRDRGVGEHPLDVGLGDREDRADHHGEDRDDPA